jgi:uncharacterized protein (DUF58 family)
MYKTYRATTILLALINVILINSQIDQNSSLLIVHLILLALLVISAVLWIRSRK